MSFVFISEIIGVLRIIATVIFVIVSGICRGMRHFVYGDSVLDFIFIHCDGIQCRRYYGEVR